MLGAEEKAQLMGEWTEKDMRHFRRLAFVAVALSTVTMLACVVILPLSYQYIQKIQSTVTSDVEFCRVRKIFFHLHIQHIRNRIIDPI